MEEAIIIRSLALTLPDGFDLPSHEHTWAQLIYATSGVVSVHTEEGAWVVPSLRAVWVPPSAAHRIETSGTVALRTLYFSAGLARALPDVCSVLQISPLVREIVQHVFELGFLCETEPAESRLAAVLVDQLVATAEVPLDLRMPTDPRAQKVADKLRAEPDNAESLQTLARAAGASARTLERLFRKEVGMTFGRWRQQARLLKALALLARGRSVSDVSLEVGYESTSAFIAMFKSRLGRTPRQYYSSRAHRPIPRIGAR